MKRKYKRMRIPRIGILITILLSVIAGNYQSILDEITSLTDNKPTIENFESSEEVPSFDGRNYVLSVNNNQPEFTDEDLLIKSNYWQIFSDLDSLNRVGPANALLHRSMMPTKKRGSIRNVYPSGWHQKKLNNEKWLYNRSHLIGFQLTGEDANWKNLFTGTEQMNQKEMLQYETIVADYLIKTGNHVRYRVTPRFINDELVCRGIQMEAKSIEDDQVSFNVFIFNIQDNITINYATGIGKKN